MLVLPYPSVNNIFKSITKKNGLNFHQFYFSVQTWREKKMQYRNNDKNFIKYFKIVY